MVWSWCWFEDGVNIDVFFNVYFGLDGFVYMMLCFDILKGC